MAARTLGSQTSSGSGETCTWTLDYDGTSSIGITVTGQASELIVTVQQVATGKDYSVDCVHGPAGTRDVSGSTLADGTVRPAGTFLLGNIFNQGRQVLIGPGSVIGDTTNVPPSAVPTPVKGTIFPYEFSALWLA